MIPSRVFTSGLNSLSVLSICWDGVTDLTATGSTSSDALALTSVFNQVSTTAASTGVMLPSTEMGEDIVVANDGANTLTVYPQSGSTIDGSASVSIAAGKRRIFFAFSNTLWISLLGA